VCVEAPFVGEERGAVGGEQLAVFSGSRVVVVEKGGGGGGGYFFPIFTCVVGNLLLWCNLAKRYPYHELFNMISTVFMFLFTEEGRSCKYSLLLLFVCLLYIFEIYWLCYCFCACCCSVTEINCLKIAFIVVPVFFGNYFSSSV
jgi:hypothetical protein